MKAKKILLLFSIIIILSGCLKPIEEKKTDDYYSSDFSNREEAPSMLDSRLPIPYTKLETFLGVNFIPAHFELTNIDLDIEEEIVIAYKKNESSTINITFFDIFPKEVIKKKIEFETELFDEKNFIFQNHNMFSEDDISIIFEGKSADKETLLYIYLYNEEIDQYSLIKQFTGDYSIIVDYEEVEDKEKKFTRLKEVTTIDNTFSSTNSHMQQKNVYIWDYEINEFTLAETSRILSPITEIDRSVLGSDNFLQFIDGFWYPEKYKKLLEKKKDLSSFDKNNIEFIHFSNSPREVTIKYNDYLKNYSIVKINKLWGQKPGIRVKIRNDAESTKFSNKYIEIFLMDHTKIFVKGPGKFQNINYYRFQRPFIEYVEETKAADTTNNINTVKTFLTGTFYNNDNIMISFTGNNALTIQKDDVIEKGAYNIKQSDTGYLFTILMNETSKIIHYQNFIITVSSDMNTFSLLPVKIKLDGFIIDNFKSLNFKKDIDHEN